MGVEELIATMNTIFAGQSFVYKRFEISEWLHHGERRRLLCALMRKSQRIEESTAYGPWLGSCARDRIAAYVLEACFAKPDVAPWCDEKMRCDQLSEIFDVAYEYSVQPGVLARILLIEHYFHTTLAAEACIKMLCRSGEKLRLAATVVVRMVQLWAEASTQNRNGWKHELKERVLKELAGALLRDAKNIPAMHEDPETIGILADIVAPSYHSELAVSLLCTLPLQRFCEMRENILDKLIFARAGNRKSRNKLERIVQRMMRKRAHADDLVDAVLTVRSTGKRRRGDNGIRVKVELLATRLVDWEEEMNQAFPSHPPALPCPFEAQRLAISPGASTSSRGAPRVPAR